MYSKNDYRYYLENQLMHSDDFLAHYGVKGMKWKKHKSNSFEDNMNRWNDAFKEPYIEKYTSDGKISREWWDSKSSSKRNNARDNAIKSATSNVENAAKKVSKSIINKPKTKKKNKLEKIRKKYGLYRETPKGQKLKGSRNIYVSHS